MYFLAEPSNWLTKRIPLLKLKYLEKPRVKSMFSINGVHQHLLANLSGISCWQNVKIREQSACLYHSLVPGLLLLFTKKDVVLQCGILNPGLLRNVSH